MKKIILTVMAFFAVGIVKAQEIKYGAKAGFNLSTFTGDEDDAKSLAGFHIGGFAEFKITDKFSVQPELLYSAQGAKIEFTYDDGIAFLHSEEKVKLGYLTLPVMAKYYVIPGLSVEAGPQVGFLLSAKNKYDFRSSFYGENLNESGEADIKDNLKSIDFGLNFGVSYEFTENIFVQARYNLGLSEINDNADSDFEVKNAVLQVSLGYKF